MAKVGGNNPASLGVAAGAPCSALWGMGEEQGGRRVRRRFAGAANTSSRALQTLTDKGQRGLFTQMMGAT